MALRAHRHAEVRHFIRASGASAYFIADVVGGFDYRPMAAEMAAEFPSLRRVIVAGDPAPGQTTLASHVSTEQQDAIDQALQPVRPAAEEVSTMLLSGGTTSLSKLIPRTHNDYVLNARLCAQAAGFDANTVFMAVLPLAHNYNLASPGLLGAFYAGGTLVIGTSTDTTDIFSTIQRERVTVIAAVVPLISNWLNSDVPKRFDLSSLKVVQNGGARLAPELRARIRQELRCTPQEDYGTAEGLINMVRLDDPDDLLLESSGAPVCDLEAGNHADLHVGDGRHGRDLRRLDRERARPAQRVGHRRVRRLRAVRERRQIEALGQRSARPQRSVLEREPRLCPRAYFVGVDALEAVLGPADETGAARAESAREVESGLRAAAAAFLHLQHAALVGETLGWEVAQVLGDRAEELHGVLGLARDRESSRDEVDHAVHRVRRVVHRLEREVLDEVRDARHRHRLVGAADAEDEAGLERALDRARAR